MTRNPIAQAPPRYQASDFPKVDRTLKGDRLVTVTPETCTRARRRRARAGRSVDLERVGEGRKDRRRRSRCRPAKLDPELAEALSAPPLAQYDVSMSLEAQPLDESEDRARRRCRGRAGADARRLLVQDLQPVFRKLSLGSAESMERWQPGEEPMIVLPARCPIPT